MACWQTCRGRHEVPYHEGRGRPSHYARQFRHVVTEHAENGNKVYSDQNPGYLGLQKQGYTLEQVNHSVKEYVNGQAHTNGIESFWAGLKRGYYGTYHKMSAKQLQRYVNEFAGRQTIRDLDTIDQMAFIAKNLVGKRLRYQDLVS